MTEPLGFIGLGDLGRPLAANLIKAGYPLTVFNRTESKGDGLVAMGAKRVLRAVDAVERGGVVVTLLWDDASVETMAGADGFAEKLGPGGVHLSMSTLSPKASQRLSALHARHGSYFVEAPIFGRPEAALARKLWIPYAGPLKAKERIAPLLTALGAQGVFDFGEEIGAATTVKLVGNFLLISAASSVGEAMTLVQKAGFDPAATLQMLTQTLFTGPIYQAYAQMAATRQTPAPSAIPSKDLSLMTATAHDLTAPTPIADLLLALRTPQNRTG